MEEVMRVDVLRMVMRRRKLKRGFMVVVLEGSDRMLDGKGKLDQRKRK
jgi:hypothetical protein